jgi:hypothetical protein
VVTPYARWRPVGKVTCSARAFAIDGREKIAGWILS